MNQQMIRKLQQMQKDLTEDQKKLERTEFSASVQGIEVTVLGNKKIIDIKLNSEMLDDIEILQDSIVVAVNEAINKVDKATEKLMSKYQMPGLPF